MSIPKLLDPAAVFDKGPNNIRMLALGHFGEVALALLNDHDLPLTSPSTLDHESVGEWRDAISEEIFLLAQTERDLAKKISASFEDFLPLRKGQKLAVLIEFNAAVVVVPVDFSRGGSWMHLWLLDDVDYKLENDNRGRLEGTDEWNDYPQYKLFVVTTEDVPDRLTGYSWQLGGSLAERALASKYKIELASKWIVTGQVRDEKIMPVGLGNKAKIPWKETVRNWLVPSANLQAWDGSKSDPWTEFYCQARGRCFEAPNVEAAWFQISGEEGLESNWTQGSPFPGLVPYDVSVQQGGELETDYSKVFFGREEAIQKCRQMLLAKARARACTFLLIVGDSGSGKSSLVRAGLAPRLALPGTVRWINEWRKKVFSPSAKPLSELAKALFAEDAVPQLAKCGAADAEEWARKVTENPDFAATSVGAALLPGRCLLLVADQLEEVLEAPPDGFAAALAALSRSGAAWVVATLRADRYDAFIRDKTFRKLKEDGATFDLASPEFTEIVRRPVAAARLSFETGETGVDLGYVLLEELRATGSSDALPLLQMTLKRLFEEREPASKTLTFHAYEKKIGKLEGAISGHAEKVMENLIDDSRAELRPLLLALTKSSLAGGYLARPTPRAAFETTLARRALVKELLKARLLVVGQQDELRVAHEALLRNWVRAADILKTHDFLLRLRDKLEPLVRDWSLAGKPNSHLLPRSPLLASAEPVLDQLREISGTDEMVEFVEASFKKATEELGPVRERLARDEQRVASHLDASEFSQAATELDGIAGYLAHETDPDLVKRFNENQERRQRVRRLAVIYTGAGDAETFSGEEDFTRALSKCELALRALSISDDSKWWNLLPTEDLERPQIEHLHQTVYRALLLFSALQLVPGIAALFPRPAPGPPKPKPAFDLRKLAALTPRFVLSLVIRMGGIGSFRLPGRVDNAEALANFGECLRILSLVKQAEEARGGKKQSLTSDLVRQIAEVMSEFAKGPKGARIKYQQLLNETAPGARREPVNAADYFFIGLFNYFIAKRRNAFVARILSLLQGRFPYLDAHSPLGTAERLLRTAIALEPQHFWPHWLLGRTLLEGGEYSSAELSFNAAIALRPDYARGYEQRALALGHQWVRTKDESLRFRAKTDSAKAMEVALGDPSIFWPRGELLQLFDEMKEAIAAYSRWLELEENILALISRVTGVASLYELAGALLDRADPTASALRADAQALCALVQLTWAGWNKAPIAAEAASHRDRALIAAERALLIDSLHAHALTVKGVLLRQKGEFKDAIEVLELALEQDAFSYRAALNRAIACEQIASRAAALDAWRDLAVRSTEAAKVQRERCPPWMEDEAKAAEERICKGGVTAGT